LITTGRRWHRTDWDQGVGVSNAYYIKRLNIQNYPITTDLLYEIWGSWWDDAFSTYTYNHYPRNFKILAFNDSAATFCYQKIDGVEWNFVYQLIFKSISLDSSEVLWSRNFEVQRTDEVYSSIDVPVNNENHYILYFRTDTLEIIDQITGELVLKQPTSFTPQNILKDNMGDRLFIEQIDNSYRIYRMDGDIFSSLENEIPLDEFDITINNYPNPFNNQTTIIFNLQRPENIEISIYNILGEKIETLVNKYFHTGSHKFKLFTDNLASGIYFLCLRNNNKSIIKKIILAK
jgi:hypothetical protein